MTKAMTKVAVLVAAMAVSGSAVAAAKKGIDRTPRQVSGVVNITNATAKQLEMLPGVGRHTAGLIVEHRAKQPFKTTEDLLKVKGIGKGIFKRIKGYLTVSGPTTLVSQSAHKKSAEPARPAAKNAVGPVAKAGG